MIRQRTIVSLALPICFAVSGGCGESHDPDLVVWAVASDENQGVVLREGGESNVTTASREGYFEYREELWGTEYSRALWWDGVLLREVQNLAVVRTERCDVVENRGPKVLLDCVEVDSSGGGDTLGPIPTQEADIGQLGVQRIVPFEYLPGGTIRHAATLDVVYARLERVPEGLTGIEAAAIEEHLLDDADR